MSCRIPDEKFDLELHRLVTRYQMHKCSAYCKRRRKLGSTFVSRCRFQFPRQACEAASLNSVEDSLRSRKKVCNLPCTEKEETVNDYIPLLLWKANMDLQFTAEASLAIAHYVSGYVTKAEKCNMQELWQEIGENRSLYSRLWSFGVRSLRLRECGLYEASDLFVGHHLMEKWVKVGMPHKRNRRLKKHKELTAMAQGDPDCDKIFEENLVDTHYPQRPGAMGSVCLYDFVALYVFDGRDRNRERQYRRR